LSQDSQVGILKFPQFGFPQLWGRITLRADLWLQWGLKKGYILHWEFPNGMLHATCTLGNWVDSRLLMVGSQITSLTLGLSFDHNLCFRSPNGRCEPILKIYVSITFQWYKKNSNRWVLTPTIVLWRFGSPFGTPSPTMGVHLGMWRFIPSHSLHSRKHVMWFLGLSLGLQPCKPLSRLQAQG
jgi:hypothetical protein